MWALGMVMSAWAAGSMGAQNVEAPAGTIEGIVYDSLLTRGPLRGATVYVIGTTLVATTDSRGRFAISGVADGAHTLTFSHPVFDAAGVQAPQVGVSVAGSSKARLTIATPKGATLVNASCPGPRAEQTGLLIGVVRDVENGQPLPKARVVSRWFEITIGNEGPRYETLETSAGSDQNGVFRLCGIPADIPVLVRARSGTQESGRVEVYFGGQDVVFRDFSISTTDSAAQIIADSLVETSVDSTAAMGARGAGIARGTVRDVNGRPLANVRVGTLDRGTVVLTNAEGEFTLAGIPAGTQTLELRAIGYAPARQAVVLKTNTPTEVTTKLDRAAQTLANVRVLGERRDARLMKAGFEDRRRGGVGFFMNAAEIAHRSGIYLGDVLRMAPGIMASYTPRGRIFTMRSNWGGDRCSPTYYLDGMRWYALDQNPILELERYIQLHDLAAVEVYAGGASTPAQFDGGNGCGAVVFWTKQ